MRLAEPRERRCQVTRVAPFYLGGDLIENARQLLIEFDEAIHPAASLLWARARSYSRRTQGYKGQHARARVKIIRMPDSRLRALPSVDSLLREPKLRQAPPALVAALARETLDDIRAAAASGAAVPVREDIVRAVAARLDLTLQPPLRPLINATGVILHTNLGRAPLAEEAREAMAALSRGYTNLELDLATGRRGSRQALLEPLLCRLTGAEAAMAVNNNAAAVLLALTALCGGKDVLIGRGQLVEIGGGFRIPDVMRQSRARLVEVGTTNRTRVADYEAAVTPRTAAIMRVHASNFKIVGFTEAPRIEEMAAVARRSAVYLLDDLGSGCLLDTKRFGLPAEPTPQESIAAGADLAMFSGDKLLGGPQGGLIVGRQALVEKLKKHPLARALRLDKASIAGLAATLRLYAENRALERIPVWRMIAARPEEIARRAQAIAGALGERAGTTGGHSMIGGGSLPQESLPTTLVALAGRATRISASLRAHGVIARIDGGRVMLDPRTIHPDEDATVIAACRAAMG